MLKLSGGCSVIRRGCTSWSHEVAVQSGAAWVPLCGCRARAARGEGLVLFGAVGYGWVVCSQCAAFMSRARPRESSGYALPCSLPVVACQCLQQRAVPTKTVQKVVCARGWAARALERSVGQRSKGGRTGLGTKEARRRAGGQKLVRGNSWEYVQTNGSREPAPRCGEDLDGSGVAAGGG